MSIRIKRAVKIILTWNGQNKPFQLIAFDEMPQFDFVLFNYSGNAVVPEESGQNYYASLINCKTEFKGEILKAIYHYYKDDNNIEYLCFMDDDIEIPVSAINKLIQLAYENKLDAFQAAVNPECFYSYQFNVLKPGLGIEYVKWVEIMTPFYRKQLFDAAHDFYETNISSYGIDNFAIPFYQQVLGLTKSAVIHDVSMKHLRPVTDGSKVFSNGLTARQEGELVRKKILEMIEIDPSIKLNRMFLREVLEVNTFRWKAWKNLLKDYFKKFL
jgi:hypothetical protein